MTDEIWKEILGFIVKGFHVEFVYQKKIQAIGIAARYLSQDGVLFCAEAYDISIPQAWDRVKFHIAEGVAHGKLKK